MIPLDGRGRSHLGHAYSSGINPIRTPVGREHHRVAVLPQMHAGPQVVEDAVGGVTVQ